jgi:plastocyanin
MLLASLGLSGCTDDTNPRALQVRLSDFAIKSAANPVLMKSGNITITSVNVGTSTHEVVLFKTDLDPLKLPLKDDGSVNERGVGLDLIDEAEGIKPGATKSFKATIEPGKYVLVCNMVDDGTIHYMKGMFLAITVTA